jgi:hypothetical protein
MIILNEQPSLFETQKRIIGMYFEKYTHIQKKLLTSNAAVTAIFSA